MTSAENQHENTQPDAQPENTVAGGQQAPGAGAPTEEPWGEQPGGADLGGADPGGAGQSDRQDAGEPGEPGEPGEMVDDLAKAQADVAALTADLQRLQAEYVNYKRRVDRDRELVRQNATFTVLSDLLPVLDDLDRAREHGELEGGFKAVADSLERIVANLGLEKFGKPGDEFDPTMHEALMHAHSAEVTTTTCQHIVQAGYRMGDRVVRAARVTVVDPEPDAPAGEGGAETPSEG